MARNWQEAKDERPLRRFQVSFLSWFMAVIVFYNFGHCIEPMKRSFIAAQYYKNDMAFYLPVLLIFEFFHIISSDIQDMALKSATCMIRSTICRV